MSFFGSRSRPSPRAPRVHKDLAPFVVSPGDGEKMYVLLRDALDLLDRLGVEHWVCAGTLLGACRHGGIIPWDDDLDLCVGPLDAPNIAKILDEATQGDRDDWRVEPTWFGLKLWRGDDRWPFVDLFETEYDPSTVRIQYASRIARETWPDEWWSVSELYPLRGINFGVRGVRARRDCRPPAPNDSRGYLRRAYGKKWRDVARTPVWDHRRDCWHDEEQKAAAAVDVPLGEADRVALGHTSLASLGRDAPRLPAKRPLSMGDVLRHLPGALPADAGGKEKE